MARIHWQDGRDLLTRAVAPGVVLFGLVVGIGLLLNGPLKGLDDAEDRLSSEFNRNRGDLWDPFSGVFSRFGNTESVIAVCLLVVAVLWWRTKDWRWSVVPLIAISLQATIFLFATIVVGRQRPPAIPMDASPPTSSFPSGHVGAATALYVSFLFLAQRIDRAWLRQVVSGLCVLIPLLVAVARLYRGAHHVSDVVIGLLNGLVCAVLAHQWWKHRRESAS
jgi:hypothetical protein